MQTRSMSRESRDFVSSLTFPFVFFFLANAIKLIT